MPLEVGHQIVPLIGTAYSKKVPYVPAQPAQAPAAATPAAAPPAEERRPVRAEFAEPNANAEFWHPNVAPSLQPCTLYVRAGARSVLTQLVTATSTTKSIHHMVVLPSSTKTSSLAWSAEEMVAATGFMSAQSFTKLGLFTWFNATGAKVPKDGAENFHVESFFYFFYSARTLAYPAATQDGMTFKAKRDASGATLQLPNDDAYTILLLMTGASGHHASAKQLRQRRWKQELADFDFQIIYRPANHQVQSDALSRREEEEPTNEEDQLLSPTQLCIIGTDKIIDPQLIESIEEAQDQNERSQLDAVVSRFRYQCLPVPPSEPPSLLEIEDMEDIIAAPGGT
ncbi:hypothetical protein HDU86_006731 [Geranomyces michiganensis]|nr:hypothetical protein HDU86_006731 [Geranomyces michiganensis]